MGGKMNEIGTKKEDMDTPALLINLDLMEKNLATMMNFFKGKRAHLRAHTKVHRSPLLAHKQIESGAMGIACQKVRQAEVMAQAGIKDILVPNIIATPDKIDRLASLAKQTDITVLVDDIRNGELLSKRASKLGATLNVFMDVNVGSQRFGVEPGDPALRLASQIEALPGVRLTGLMANLGHLGNIEPRTPRRREEIEKAEGLLINTKNLIEKAGMKLQKISTGSTATYDVSVNNRDVTEVRAGSYMLMDYPEREHVPEFDCAVTVLGNVISKHPDGILVLDAGMASISSANGPPEILQTQIVKDARLELLKLHAENALLKVNIPGRIDVGDKVEFIPSYLDGTMIRHEKFFGMRGDRVELIGDILGRNAST
jgi:D-serine deaminase-like pyridoxal phosphate-dependent protein